MQYGLFNKFVSRNGKRDELITILLQAAELLQQNKECHSYIVGKTDKPDEIWVFELWKNKEAHDTSLERENIYGLIMTARPLIAGVAARTEFQALGGKGL